MRLTVGAVNVRTGEMRYFDSRDEPLGVEHVHGLRRAAAGVSRGAHRRRAVLGRRHLFEHADRGRARRQAAPRLADLRRQRVAAGRPRADDRSGRSWAGTRTSSSPAAPRATSRARSRSTACATSSASSPSTCRPSVRRRREVQELAVWGCGTTMHVVRLLSPAPRRRGPHQGHRLHARGHREPLEGGLRPCPQVLAEKPWQQRGRPAGRHRHPRSERVDDRPVLDRR